VDQYSIPLSRRLSSEQAGSISGISASGVDRHRFDADPDPNFHVDQKDADLMRILPQVSHMLENALFLL